MTAQTMRVYQGTILRVEVTRDWLLFFTQGNSKPVAFSRKGFFGAVPKAGEKISVEASEGRSWWFARHRDAAVITDEGHFDISSLPNSGQHDRNAVVINMILNHLAHYPQVCSDDIIEDAKRLFPDADPRGIGHPFRMLSERRIIHKIGWKKSTRSEINHSRDIAVWEKSLPSSHR